MPIKNHRTRVAPEKTISEIGALLARKGASRVSTEYGPTGNVAAVTFDMDVVGVSVHFRLPANIEGVARALASGKHPTKTQSEHAEWVSWRIIKDWIDAQIALIESNQAAPAQVFMPYAQLTAPSGERRPMYDLFLDNHRKILTDGAA